MLSDYNSFKLLDKQKKNDMVAEINWRDDPSINECRTIRFKLVDKECCVDRNELNSLLFAIGSEDEQKKMIPQKLIRTKHYETVLTIKATKDIRKGENIVVPVSIKLPAVEKEVIGEVARKLKLPKDKIGLKTKSGIVVPGKVVNK